MKHLYVDLFLGLASLIFSNARGRVKISFLVTILTAESVLLPSLLNRFFNPRMSSSASSPSLTMIVDFDDVEVSFL